jgi:soluble lytic murein transglycosylase-like protein
MLSLCSFAFCGWVVPPASAQVSSVVGDNGKRVFINDPPAEKAASRARAASTGARVLPASLRSGSPGRPAHSAEDLHRMAQEAAERHEIDPALIRAIIETESQWDPMAVSAKGALGLMQLMPATADELGVQDPFDPAQNLEGGVRHLRRLLERFDGDLDRSLAAYNAGHRAVTRARGVPNYPETRSYVRKVTDAYFGSESGRWSNWWKTTQPVYQDVDSRGKRVFTNQ